MAAGVVINQYHRKPVNISKLLMLKRECSVLIIGISAMLAKFQEASIDSDNLLAPNRSYGDSCLFWMRNLRMIHVFWQFEVSFVLTHMWQSIAEMLAFTKFRHRTSFYSSDINHSTSEIFSQPLVPFTYNFVIASHYFGKTGLWHPNSKSLHDILCPRTAVVYSTSFASLVSLIFHNLFSTVINAAFISQGPGIFCVIIGTSNIYSHEHLLDICKCVPNQIQWSCPSIFVINRYRFIQVLAQIHYT